MPYGEKRTDEVRRLLVLSATLESFDSFGVLSSSADSSELPVLTASSRSSL